MTVISPELVQEVETRMNRQHIPPLLPVVTTTRTRIRKPQISALPTVQESHRISGNNGGRLFLKYSKIRSKLKLKLYTICLSNFMN